MRSLSIVALALAVSSCGGANTPTLTADGRLPIRRVVLYQNGMAYFERRGSTERADQDGEGAAVGGDAARREGILGTLTLRVRGGARVRRGWPQRTGITCR